MKTVNLFVDQEKIRLTRDGRWLSNDQEITHGQTVHFFFSHLERAPGGGYQIRNDRETKTIEVEDTAYFVLSLEGSAQKGYQLVLSDGNREKLDPGTLKYTPPDRLVCRVKKSREEARFLRSAYHELLSGIRQDDSGAYWLEISDIKIKLDPTTGP